MGKQRLSPSYNSIKTTALSSDDTELYQTNLLHTVNFSKCHLHLSWYIRLPKHTEPLINKQKSRWHGSRTSIYNCYHSRASAGGYFRKLDSVFFWNCCLCVYLCSLPHCKICSQSSWNCQAALLLFVGVIWSHCLYFLHIEFDQKNVHSSKQKSLLAGGIQFWCQFPSTVQKHIKLVWKL